MLVPNNIRFLVAGLAIGFISACVLFFPAAPESTALKLPPMTVVMDLKSSNLKPNRIIIPARTAAFDLLEGDVYQRALRHANEQKYHLIIREAGGH